MANNNENKILNVPNLRFPEFSGEWVTKSINDLAVVIGGGTPDTTVKSYWDGEIQWFTPSEIGKNKYVDSSLRTITEVGLNNSSAKLLPPNTILLSSRATIGECSLSLRECATNQGFQCLVSKKCNVDFLYYLIQTKKKDLIRKSCGSTFLEISANEVRKIQVSVPSDVEQQKIAELLSLIDERIATQNKIIEDLKKLKSAITDLLFHSIADAHTIRLGEIAHITNGAGDVQDANTEHQEDWYPFFDRSEELKWFPTYSFDKEAVIYAGEGQSFYPRYYNGKFALHQRCYAITDFASCIIPKYCYHFMNTLNSYFVRNSVGSTVPSLRMDIFQKVEIRLPPIPKQQHICKIIDAFYTKLEVEQRGISILQELKQFLLSQMFI
ncbi:restriction endonuclease subunit S [Bacteroides uniformis]|uniref:Restriction endonuclease subunit S n=1 Tax=Bacteroides xylanisolvens TaxID=371601 RepID=A0A7J5PI50_9BACE|nr:MULTISPECIES: restriction endonuclease subunit S [Bacteroides]KAB4165590.1 restriction endonuclease subunit S [Bacteroides uniformis]KAB6107110.1 restriction endonuclease subunit S [Bacteroides xylanisolvens]KAB6114556.1 restriction endonuclease subunit S [Bacteroides xylanisolvens]KAB6120686.1 restriction endonuclease subunit S [Bacteroides xylanisolvens]KAB6126863.1 restriction endonuclease subunit S [Bacteroides xylanisolvens]